MVSPQTASPEKLAKFILDLATSDGADPLLDLGFILEYRTSPSDPLRRAFFLILCEYVLRTNPRLCSQAGLLLRSGLDSAILEPSDVLAVAARWELNPIPGWRANLGAGLYEHLAEKEEHRRAFASWREHPVLRRRYIEVGYNLPIIEEIELYEWAISLGETDAVQSSLETFGDGDRTPPSDPQLVERWKHILAKCTPRAVDSPPTPKG